MIARTIENLVVTRWRTWSAEHRSILSGMVTVSSLVIMAKLAGAAKEMAVAWRYGVGPEVDAYLLVFNLVNLPISIWFSVLAVVLIPLAARVRREASHELPRFGDELLGWTLIGGVMLAVIGLLGLPSLVTSTWLGLPSRTATLALQMVPVLVWLAPLGFIVSLYSTWTMSIGRYVNTLLEGLPALVILLAVLLAGGIEPLIWGTLAGFLVQAAALVGAGGDRVFRVAPSFRISSPQWAPFWQAFGIVILGQAILSLTSVMDQFFAARLGEGAISSLGYAGRILALALSLVATAVTRSTLPVFSQARAAGTADVRHVARRWTLALALIGTMMVAVGWLLAPWAVRILFERGTFTSGDTHVVAHLLRLGLLQLPFYFASLVFVSLHSSFGRYKLLLWSGIAGLGAKVMANVLLIPTFNVGALMLSNVAVYAVNTIVLVRARSR